MKRGKGSVVYSNFLCSEYDGSVDHAANQIESWEWDHSCNTRDVATNGKYLEEVGTFDIDGIQGRHVVEYFEQRKPKVGMLLNYYMWGGV